MKRNGFTLSELLAVIVIMGLIIGISIPVFTGVRASIREKEYNSKKQYIENVAVKYAEENDYVGKMTVGRLIALGYLSADKYVVEGETEIPFIINPKSQTDNLACRGIQIEYDESNYRATMDEESNCAIVINENAIDEMEIKVYPINDFNKILTRENGNEFAWTNQDVLIYIGNINNIKEVYVNGVRQQGAEILSNINGYNNNNYKNVIKKSIDNNFVLKEPIKIQVDYTDGSTKSADLIVKIDKKAPEVIEEATTGWRSINDEIFVYLADGNGSGTSSIKWKTSRDDTVKERTFDNDIAIINDSTLETGNIVYIWAKDNAGNESEQPSKLIVKNIDSIGPYIGEVTYDKSLSGYKVDVSDLQSGIKFVKYCLNDTNCDPKTGTILQLSSKGYVLPSSITSNKKKMFLYAEDNVGNKTYGDNGGYPIEKPKYKLTVKHDDNIYSASGGGQYECGKSVTVSATPKDPDYGNWSTTAAPTKAGQTRTRKKYTYEVSELSYNFEPTEDIILNSDNKSFTFDMPCEDTTVTVYGNVSETTDTQSAEKYTTDPEYGWSEDTRVYGYPDNYVLYYVIRSDASFTTRCGAIAINGGDVDKTFNFSGAKFDVKYNNSSKTLYLESNKSPFNYNTDKVIYFVAKMFNVPAGHSLSKCKSHDNKTTKNGACVTISEFIENEAICSSSVYTYDILYDIDPIGNSVDSTHQKLNEVISQEVDVKDVKAKEVLSGKAPEWVIIKEGTTAYRWPS